MIYIKSFKNYEEFKQIFGVVEHGNGVKSRKNKILLACLKDRKLLHWWLKSRERAERNEAAAEIVHDADYLYAANMGDLKRFAKMLLDDAVFLHHVVYAKDDIPYNVLFRRGFGWRLYHPTLCLDEFMGLCTDGDTKSIRYVNTERDDHVFKMKAGKFVSRCIEDDFLADVMPEQMKRWIGEEFAREWQSFAEQHVDVNRYKLHVDYNFSDIYDSDRCAGNFCSCMTDKDQWYFYRDAIDCSAAYLTDANDNIVARCIVYNHVTDEKGVVYRLAERQYATGQDNVLKQILVDKLIAGGYIDGYKRVGVDCHDNRNFVANNGDSLSDKIFSIECNLEPGDTLSYQDSFVYFVAGESRAYNGDVGSCYIKLDTTDETFECGIWSEWNGCYIDDDNAYFDEYYEDYVYESDLADAIFNGQRIAICRERAAQSAYFAWSEHENAFIHSLECCYVDREGDYFLTGDCVEDWNGVMQLENDCNWSECVAGYVHEDDSYESNYEQDYIPKCMAFHSTITGDYYCCKESMLKHEKEYRAQHALVLVA